jgi:hypothetical protein
MRSRLIGAVASAFAAGCGLGAIFMACATTPQPLIVHPTINAAGDRCYSESDDTAMRERMADYATCCEAKK